MKAPEVYPVQSLNLGGFAVAGVLALALSLAGVMGGYQLLGAALGTEDPEEVVTSSAGDASACPAHLQAAEACDYDTDTTPARSDAGGCDGAQVDGPAASGRHDAAPAAFNGGR